MVEVEILQQKGYNFLWIDKNLWMWDIPIERKEQRMVANRAFGNVLVAGYGLGLVQKALLENPKVDSIVTVENLKEVVDEVKRVFGEVCGRVVISNFYDFNEDKKYDCVIGDIWEDITPRCLEDYRKFKEKAIRLLKPKGKVLAWGKEFFEYLLNKEGLDGK